MVNAVAATLLLNKTLKPSNYSRNNNSNYIIFDYIVYIFYKKGYIIHVDVDHFNKLKQKYPKLLQYIKCEIDNNFVICESQIHGKFALRLENNDELNEDK